MFQKTNLILLIFRKITFILLMFQKITQTVRNKSKSSFNDFKWRKMALCCSKKLSALLKGIIPKSNDDLIVLIASIFFRKKKSKIGLLKRVCENKAF